MDDSWSPKEHIYLHHLPRNGADDEHLLMECVSKLQNLPMDKTKPLWDVHIVENYSRGWAMLYRIHHCVGDGYSLEACFCSLCDNTFEEMLEALPPVALKMKEPSFVKQCLYRIMMLVWFVSGLPSVVMKWTLAALMHDPKTVFKRGKLVSEKKLAWTHPNEQISVDECKKVAHKFNATINDVMMSCFAGGMQRYMAREIENSKKEIANPAWWQRIFFIRWYVATIVFFVSMPWKILRYITGRNDGITYVRAAMPVNLRNPLNSIKLLKQHKYEPCQNKFGFLTPSLPITGFNDPVKRLIHVSKELREGKCGVERVVSGMASLALAFLPRWFVRIIFSFLTTGITLAVTNVRGFPGELRMTGTTLSRMLGFVPGPSSCEITAAIISYNNNLNLCLNCNASTIRKPTELINDFMEEYKSLRDASAA
jgi:hypothetical protein